VVDSGRNSIDTWILTLDFTILPIGDLINSVVEFSKIIVGGKLEVAKFCKICGRKIGFFEKEAYIPEYGLVCFKCYNEVKESRLRELKAIILTTSPSFEGKRITEYKEIIHSEVVLGVSIFRDMFSDMRDIVGGRVVSYQKELNKAVDIALNELRQKARDLGANAVIGVEIDFNQLTGRNKSSLMVVATGTAVVVENDNWNLRKTF